MSYNFGVRKPGYSSAIHDVVDRLFVYGTLRTGQHARSMILDHVARAEPATTQGTLIGFDDYPGLRQSLGREGCDRFLGKLAEELRSGLRGADRLFRLANDEFVILLPETDTAGALIAAQRLLTITVRLTASAPSGPIPVPVRFGGATFPHEKVRTSEDLVREAARSLRELLTKGGEQRISLPA